VSTPLPDSVVLVGGKGSRLRSVVSDRLKPLAPVAGRPFLEWLLLQLRNQGVGRAVLSAGYRADQIEAFAGAWTGPSELELIVVREPVPLGTGGGLRHALREVRTPEVLVLNGDSFCAGDLSALARARRDRGARAALLLTHVEDAARYGAVALGADGEIEAFREKTRAAGPGLINAGVYAMDREAVAGLPEGRQLSLERDVFPGWVGGELVGVVSRGPFIDIGTPESYAAAHDHIDWHALAAPLGA
jgi:NDP-sugar pyrophosphorylase family protein